MKRLSLFVFLGLVLSFGFAQAQDSIYMIVQGERQGLIQGTSTDEGKKGAIVLQQANLMASSRRARLKEPVSESIRVVKEVDISSPKLAEAHTSGERFTRIEISFYRATAEKPHLYQKLTLYDAKITSRSQRSEAGKQLEEIVFSFPRIVEEAFDAAGRKTVSERGAK